MKQSNRSKKSKQVCPLLYADTQTSPDQLYFGGFSVTDPFVSFSVAGQKHAVLSALELSRGLKESSFDIIHSLEAWQEKAALSLKKKSVTIVDVIVVLARHFRIKKFRVPEDFPVGLAFDLAEAGLGLEVTEGPFFPEREKKSDEEAEAIREGNRCSAAGIRAAETVLRRSRIKGNRLVYEGKTLTSERLRTEIEIACLRTGGISMGTIAAGGDQGCDPHCVGSGPLRPHELIIVDVFPRIVRTGYHGDMTRTFLKGKASDAQARLVETVRAAQQEALEHIHSGVSGKSVHKAVVAHFEERGYETTRSSTGASGFFHGTGHGLGLAVHEPPRLSVAGPRLRVGNVVTVEPGLYYPGLGGCRIEDVVRVNREGYELLSNYHYRWRIR